MDVTNPPPDRSLTPSSGGTVPVREPRALPLPGEFLGPYRLIFELASGGMASIYVALAEQRAGAHRIVAVKRLHAHLADDPNFRKMFLDEAQIASQIRHPNVCAVFDYGAQGGAPYIVMEYVAGEPVSAIWAALPRNGPMIDKWRRASLAARIVADTCEALHAAHELRSIDGEPLNVVHRDVSPENLLVTYDGVVKLCDFGIAIAARQEHSTEAGMLKGKFAYIQPEVLRGKRPDRRSDIWSLGVVLWELMTGERLFRRGSALETLRAVGEAIVPAPSAVTGVAEEFDAVVLRALSPNPDERFESAREFAAAINAAIATAGHYAGLGDVADWMAELFPGGRAKKERLVALAATFYEPLATTGASTAEPILDDRTETATFVRPQASAARRAVDRESVGTRSSAFGQEVGPRAEEPNPRWRRPLTTFVLGAVLATEIFSPAKRAARDGERSEPSVGARSVTAPAVARPDTDVSGAPFVFGPTGLLGRSDGEPMMDSAMTCDVRLSVGDREPWRAGELSPAVDTNGTREIELTTSGRRRDVPRASPPTRGAGLFDTSGSKLRNRASSIAGMPPVRSLELAPDFAAYTPMNLLPPTFAMTARRSSDAPSVDPIPFRPSESATPPNRLSRAQSGTYF